MKNKKILGALALGTAFIAPISVQAAGFETSANVSLVTQYVFRGITQSDENFAVQGGYDLSHDSGFYAGVWGSSVDFNDSDEANLEIDLYGGYSGEFKGLSYDLGVIRYAYPGANDSLNYDFTEYSFALGHDFDVFAASASINYSPDYFAGSGNSTYTALNVDVPLPRDVSFSGHVGRQIIDDNAAFGTPDYTDWSAGLNYNLEGFDLSLTYIDTNLDEPGECADGCAERVVFGVSKSF